MNLQIARQIIYKRKRLKRNKYANNHYSIFSGEGLFRSD